MKKISEQLKFYPRWRPKKNPENTALWISGSQQTHKEGRDVRNTSLQTSADNTEVQSADPEHSL